MATIPAPGFPTRPLSGTSRVALVATCLLAAGPAAAAQLSGYFRHSSNDFFINIETQQTAATGPLSDVNIPSLEIGGAYTVDYGLIRLSSSHLGIQTGTGGFSNAGATATFSDQLTITSPTAPDFSFGTMLARIDISGTLAATGNGQSIYIVDVAAPSFLRQITGAFYGDGLGFPPVIIGDSFGSYLLEIPITFGLPFTLSVTGNVDSTVGLDAPGQAFTNLGSTIRWGGVLEVRDESGAALPSFTATSESGYDYATVQVVPLPAAAWLLGSGIVGLLVAGRRRPGSGAAAV